jgi:hypothetical protein
MIKFFLGILLTILIIIGGIYYAVLGVGAKDLGIKVTPQDSELSRTKAGMEIISINSQDGKLDFTLEGKKDMEFSMDSQELTALANNRPWKNYPVKNIQIKIYPDGTIESSGILIVSRTIPYAVSLGYSESQVKQAIQKYNLPSFEIPFYLIGTGSVTNDNVSVNASSAKIGLVPIPANIVSQANQEAEQLLNNLISKHSQSFHAETITFTDGKVNFKGYVPEKEYVQTE